jgi:hypothetical protein
MRVLCSVIHLWNGNDSKNKLNNMLSEIPVGDLRLYDNYTPQLAAGTYTIKVNQALTQNGTTINQDTISTTQEFVISAPQFSMDVTQVLNQYPPAGSTGQYGNSLPHIVLNDAMLPWERTLKPWLALMVFAENELTSTVSVTVSDFLNLQSPVQIPTIVKEDDVDPSSPCTYIQMPVSVFAANAPLIGELPYLAHCRQVNTGDKAIMGLNEDGMFSVVVANRFPAVSTQPVKNIVHLVSLEGMEPYLNGSPSFGSHTQVALLSMASWVFYTMPDPTEDFRPLAQNLAQSGHLWLQLPGTISGGDTSATEVNKRLAEGFLPVAYHTRTGEDSFAWYRGPLTPVLPAVLSKPAPFATSDAAMIYDKSYGLFDLSLAAAWQAGREAALSDRYFGQRLLAYRQKAHRLTDSLYNQLVNDYFSVSQLSELDNNNNVQNELLTILDAKLISDIGATPNTKRQPLKQAATTNPIADLKTFMEQVELKALLLEMVSDDLAYVTDWLGRLLLLYPLPFNKLVADERMLPIESLRFFYWDSNWGDAMLDGALSIGTDSSRQSSLTGTTKGIIQNGAMNALAAYRNKLLGNNTSSSVPTIISGFLLRSAIVAGWPNLAVRGYDAANGNGNMLNLLRMDHLSPNVLLCLFDGVPASIELSEPQEGMGFGVDDDGYAVLRNLTAPIGAQRGTLQVLNSYLRSSAGRVLNVKGLVAGLAKALNVSNIGPAQFALQMIKSPEAIVFNSQTI